jgi:hypothetical protein
MMKDYSFPEILKPYFTPEMIDKMTQKHKDKIKQIVLEYTLDLAAEVIEEEHAPCAK